MRYNGAPRVKLWNCAVGDTKGRLAFHENATSDMSSFLPLGPGGWGKVQEIQEKEVVRLDDFAREQSIDYIDVVKSDTQGYEAHVFSGADQLLRSGKIGLVYFEITMSNMYKGLPTVDELFKYLLTRDYRLVSIYDMHYQNNIVSWLDVLFVKDQIVHEVNRRNKGKQMQQKGSSLFGVGSTR